MYKGYQNPLAETKSELLACMRAMVHKRANQWTVWAGEHSQPVVDDELGICSEIVRVM